MFKRKNKFSIMMVGPEINAKGGISSVIQVYYNTGIFNHLGIHYYPTYSNKYKSKLFKSIFFVKSLIKIFFCIPKYNIIHVHTASWWSFRRLLLIIFIGKILNKKVVIHLHGGQFDIYYKQTFFLEKLMIKYGFLLSDRIIVLSNNWLKKIISFCDLTKTLIIPNAVKIDLDLQNNSLFKRKNQKPYLILFMGELIRSKGIYDLLQAIKLLNPNENQVKVFLCGDGDIDEIKKCVINLGLKKIVHIPGWVTGEYKKKLLNEAYIYVLPSYYEVLPMSILEAMATGTPVISTNVGGIPDIIKDGYNGFLIQTNSPTALAQRIKKLLEDKELWFRLSSNALDTIKKNFSIEEVEKKLHKLYLDLMEES